MIVAGAILTGCAKEAEDAAAVDSPAAAKRPNILFILADDLGYSDISPFGGEISTPILSQLADSGMRLTNMHAAPTCSPTRGMFISGTDNHRAGFGSMRGMQTAEQLGKPGYEAELSKDVVTFISMLNDSGYHTYMAGKWQQGYTPHNYPPNRGFEQSFALKPGGASHFSDMKSITSNAPTADYLDNGELVENLPDDFYSTEYYTDKLIEYIGNDHEDGKPFFAWASYTSPHWPLQVPEDELDLYKGRYDEGYEPIRAARLQKMKKLGIVGDSVEPAEQSEVWPAWDALDEETQRREARIMEVYAAMVENMDHHIGRLLDYLRSIDEYDNTVIVFMSDNGAEGATVLDLGDNREWIPANFDLSYDNIGKLDSFAEVGPNWAWVSSTPYRLYKGFVYEGGLLSPTIISWGDNIPGGAISKSFGAITDFAPTFLELAGVERHGGSYQGRKVHAMQGESMIPMLTGKADVVHGDDYVMGWELFNRRAVHQGDWKIAWVNTPWGSYEWELYNLKEDPSERNNLADVNPDKLQQLKASWDQYVIANNVIVPDRLDLPWSNSTDYFD